METSAFEAYMGDIISNGFLSLAVALGEETGLFSIMCSLDEPATIQNIADKADLKERYVKEWLGSMVDGNIVAVDSESRLYHIPQQYNEFLRSPTIIMSLIVPILASRHGNLQSCLKIDGPTGYDFCQYPQYYTWLRNIREAMADDIVNKDLIPQYGDIKDRLVGTNTGLCETVCDLGRAATIAEIAGKAGLKERYVKEWFVAMVAGRIVQVDCEAWIYHIPTHYKSMLTNTVSVISSAFVMCARRQETLESCFKLNEPSGEQSVSFKREKLNC